MFVFNRCLDMVADDARLMHDSLIMANLPPEMLALFGQYTC